jgi:hypothetical protein
MGRESWELDNEKREEDSFIDSEKRDTKSLSPGTLSHYRLHLVVRIS